MPESEDHALLLVEDDHADAALIRRELEAARELPGSFALTHADRLETGLAALDLKRFDLVLLDLTLPDASGLDTLARLRRRHPDVPVVVLTGSDREREGLEALSRGAQDYLVKGTVAPQGLKRALLYALARARLFEQGRRLEALRAEVVERLRLDSLKDQFFGTAAHELRSPVTVVRAALQTLAEGGAGALGEEQQVVADLAMRNVVHLGRLLEDFLDMSRIEAGMARVEKRAFETGPALEEAARGYALVGKRKGVAIELELRAGAPRVEADPSMFRRVLWNLLDNALRFARSRVTLRAAASPDGAAEFTVEDDGPGVPPERVPHLFQRWGHAGSPPGEDVYQGTGLGLSLCKQMLELNGGSIALETPPSGGARFRFSLPSPAEASASPTT